MKTGRDKTQIISKPLFVQSCRRTLEICKVCHRFSKKIMKFILKSMLQRGRFERERLERQRGRFAFIQVRILHSTI